MSSNVVDHTSNSRSFTIRKIFAVTFIFTVAFAWTHSSGDTSNDTLIWSTLAALLLSCLIFVATANHLWRITVEVCCALFFAFIFNAFRLVVNCDDIRDGNPFEDNLPNVFWGAVFGWMLGVLALRLGRDFKSLATPVAEINVRTTYDAETPSARSL